MNIDNLDEFTKGYLEAAFFTEENLEQKDFSDINPDNLILIIEDCKNFQTKNSSILEKAYDNEGYSKNQAGIDFFFTRNHHGAGFWDRDLKEIGEQLTELAHQEKGCDVYVGDDGAVYFNNHLTHASKAKP